MCRVGRMRRARLVGCRGEGPLERFVFRSTWVADLPILEPAPGVHWYSAPCLAPCLATRRSTIQPSSPASRPVERQSTHSHPPTTPNSHLHPPRTTSTLTSPRTPPTIRTGDSPTNRSAPCDQGQDVLPTRERVLLVNSRVCVESRRDRCVASDRLPMTWVLGVRSEVGQRRCAAAADGRGSCLVELGRGFAASCRSVKC